MPNAHPQPYRVIPNPRARDRGFVRFARAKGFMMLQMIAGVAAAAALVGMLGFTLVSVIKSGSHAQRASDTRDLLRQAAYTLTIAAVNADADDAREAPAGTDYTPGAATESPSAAKTYPTYPAPLANDGWYIPKASAAPKLDAWGSYIKYCVWDNGSIDSSTGRLTGDATATYVSAVSFAVMSAGPDKMMQTTCAQAKAGTPQGDDILRAMTNSQIVQGVGGTAYLGDAVANAAVLGTLPAVQPGQIRSDLSSGTMYVNRTGGIGADKWVAISGSTGTGNFSFPLINKPTVNLVDATTSLSAFSSVLNLSEGGVQYQAYSDAALTNLAKDSGILAAGSMFNFRPFLTTGATYYYVGRRKASITDINGMEVWSPYSNPLSSILAAWVVSAGYAARNFQSPQILSSAPTNCPAGWVGVPSMRIPNTGGTSHVVNAFCVMQYPAVQATAGIGSDAASSNSVRTAMSGNPWFSIAPWSASFNNAVSACFFAVKDGNGNNVSGARMIRLSEWLAIAHLSIGMLGNWSAGSVGGVADVTNTLFLGLTNPTVQPASYVPAVSQRREKILTSGIVYDFGGNISNFVYIDSPSGQSSLASGDFNGTGGSASSTALPLTVLDALPFVRTTRGMGGSSGTFPSTFAGRPMAMGGQGQGGIFTVDPNFDTSSVYLGTGFRCTLTPS